MPDLIRGAADSTNWHAHPVGVRGRAITFVWVLMALKAALGGVCVFTASVAWPYEVL